MSTTVTAGTTSAFELGPMDYVTVQASSPTTGSIAFTSLAPTLLPDQQMGIQNRRYGPFGVGMTAFVTVSSGSMTYTITQQSLTSAQAAAVQALVSADGTGSTPQDRLIRATDNGAILLPRAHANYHCHYFAGDYFADNNRISDRSGQGNHAVLMPALTGAVAGANAGYISTAAAANQMWEIPDPNFDFVAGESLFMHWHVKHAEVTTTAAIFGNGSGASAGLRISAVASTGVGTDYQVLLYNTSGTFFSGTNSAPGMNAPAVANTLKSVAFLFNGKTSTWSAWLNGALVRTEIAITLAGSTASALRPRVGGTQTSTIGTVITQTRALQIFKFEATDTLPVLSSFTAAVAKLIALPGQILLDGDL